MGPGRQKAALRGRTLFLIMWSPDWELGLPSGNSSEGGGTSEDICSCSLAPLFAD